MQIAAETSDDLPPSEPAPLDRVARIAVVVPCYKVRDHIVDVVRTALPFAHAVYTVDDCCPEDSCGLVEEVFADDPRVHVVRREANGGVGAAMKTGYRAALLDGMDVLVKIDGDGQMDPTQIPAMVAPIISGEADYTKANRFFSVETVSQMPFVRLVGNAGLSFMTKVSTGYWGLFDPTNGYTAIESRVAAQLPFEKIHNRYFFESDMLFRLGTLRARVVELPAVAIYGDEESNLSVTRTLLSFPFLHARNTLKRIGYNYFLRNFSVASVQLVFGVLLVGFGATFGIAQWIRAAMIDVPATSGTVMLAALPVLLGIQLLLAFLHYDVQMTPTAPVHKRLFTIKVLGGPDMLRKQGPGQA